VGLNIMQPGDGAAAPGAAAAGEAGAGPKSYLVGDGGASWRLKALRRAQVQAGKEGADLGKVGGAAAAVCVLGSGGVGGWVYKIVIAMCQHRHWGTKATACATSRGGSMGLSKRFAMLCLGSACCTQTGRWLLMTCHFPLQVVADRWGSMKDIAVLATQSGAAHANAHMSESRRRAQLAGAQAQVSTSSSPLPDHLCLALVPSCSPAASAAILLPPLLPLFCHSKALVRATCCCWCQVCMWACASCNFMPVPLPAQQPKQQPGALPLPCRAVTGQRRGRTTCQTCAVTRAR
jgi:hypothetical protein